MSFFDPNKDLLFTQHFPSVFTLFVYVVSINCFHLYLMEKTLFLIALYLHPSEFFFNRCTRPSNEGNEQQYPSVKSQLITRHSVTEPRNANNRGTNNVTSHASISEQVFINSGISAIVSFCRALVKCSAYFASYFTVW